MQATTTGAHRELIAGLLVDHSARGLALRGRPVTHPEIIEVRSATEAAILDCVDQDTGRGLFDAATGERLPDVPVVRDGQRDLTSAVVVSVVAPLMCHCEADRAPDAIALGVTTALVAVGPRGGTRWCRW